MAKNRGTLAGGAWRLLRLAQLCARKGGALRRRLVLGTGLGYSRRIHYGEREFSLDETPAFHLKMHRPASMRLPRIPCMHPPTNFDDDEAEIFNGDNRESFYQCEDNTMHGDHSSKNNYYDDYGFDNEVSCNVEGDQQEIDLQAEEFIANFYRQMKLQRQISILEYSEMLQRGTS